MTSDQWARVRSLFDAADELERRDVAAFLDANCDDPLVRAEVRRLISASDSAATQFLEAPSHIINAGTILADRFEILTLLGQGGMGQVYSSVDLSLDRTPLAIKMITAELADHDHFVARLKKELLMARRVAHPNVCPLHEFFEVAHGERKLRFITMRLIQGETLSARIEVGGPLPVDQALPIVRDICAGLEAAHSAGVIHGDLKPANVMLTGEGRAVLMDFGLSRTLEEGRAAGQTSVVLASSGFEPPEVMQRAPLSPASDIYSLGVLLYRMRTGAMPASGETHRLEPAWRRTISACLSHDPAERPRSAQAVLRSLEGNPLPIPRRWLKFAAAGIAAASLFAVPQVRKAFARAISPVPAERHVAILPFETGPQPGLAEIAAAEADRIAARLARMEAREPKFWLVSPADLTAQKATTPADAAKAFPVNLALRTRLSRDTRNVRAQLELLSTNEKKTLLTREVVSPVDELFRLSERMATEIADMLALGELPVAGSDVGTSNAEAFRAYEQGRAALISRTSEDADKAIDFFQRAAELDSNFGAAEAGLAEAFTYKYLATKDPVFADDAERTANRAVQLMPGSAESHRALSLAFDLKGKYDAAAAEIGRAIELDPGNATLYDIAAKAERALNHIPRAEALLKKSVELSPNYWGAWNKLGSFYFSQGRYLEAERAYRTLVRLQPGSNLGYNNLGGVLVVTNRCGEAIPLLQRSISIKPSMVALTNLGMCEFGLKQYQKAAEAMAAAVQLNPKEHAAWRNLGDAQRAEGRIADSNISYRRAVAEVTAQLNINARSARDLASLAMYQAKLGEKAESRRAIHTADANGSNDRTTDLYLIIAEELNGDRQEALRRARSAITSGLPLNRIGAASELASLATALRNGENN